MIIGKNQKFLVESSDINKHMMNFLQKQRLESRQATKKLRLPRIGSTNAARRAPEKVAHPIETFARKTVQVPVEVAILVEVTFEVAIEVEDVQAVLEVCVVNI